MPTEDCISVAQGEEEQAEAQKASARGRLAAERRGGPEQVPEPFRPSLDTSADQTLIKSTCHTPLDPFRSYQQPSFRSPTDPPSLNQHTSLCKGELTSRKVQWG